MGLKLDSPLVPSASPLSKDLDTVQRLEDAGASALVLGSLFEEQLLHEELSMHHYLDRDSESFGEATSFFPELGGYNRGPNGYLEHIERVKRLIDIPVIASLNATSEGGWVNYASSIEQAGADALEVNLYFLPTDPDLDGLQIEKRYVEALTQVKRVTKIPIAMKLSPFFSSIPNIAKRLVDAGADALVLFNRFYQPDIDIDRLEVAPTLTFSNSASSRLPMRWIAILHGKLKTSLAATTGIHTHEDVLKLLMAGADVTMMAAALMQNGPEYLREVETGLLHWMEDHEYESVAQLKGSMSHRASPDPGGFERANYVQMLSSYQMK